MIVAARRSADSFYRLIANVFASFPEDDVTIESLSIKKGKMFVTYKAGPTDNPLTQKKSVTVSNVRVLNLSDRKITEELNPVYQVRAF